MATHYVDSNATGLNDGTSWTNAWTSIASSTGVAAGDLILVAYNHSEDNGAELSLSFSNATRSSPVAVISADPSDSSYKLPTSKQITTGDNLTDFLIDGHVRLFGLWLEANDLLLATDTRGVSLMLVEVTVNFINTAQLQLGGSTSRGSHVTSQGCTFDFSGASSIQGVYLGEGGQATLKMCKFIPKTGQSYWFTTFPQNEGLTLVCEDCDFSGVAGLLQGVSGTTGSAKFRRCRLEPSWTAIGSGIGSDTFEITIESCDDGTISDPPMGLNHYESATGTAKHATAAYRTGGADDGEQVNAYSLEMTTSANAAEIYSSLEITLGSRWIAPDASPSGATAQGIFTSTRCDPLATPAELTTDSSSTWNGSGVGTKQKIDHTLNNGDTLTVYVASGGTLNNDDFWIEVSEPDQVGGLVTVKAFLAKPSTTVYVDPKLEIA
jgi:hypothetical protein